MSKRKYFPLLGMAILCTICCTCVVSAFMFKKDDVKVSTEPADVQCTIYETDSDNSVSDVRVENTGNYPCYIRVKAITYYTYDDGSITGKSSKPISLDLNDGWVEINGVYYYSSPVYPYHETRALCSSVSLKDSKDAQGVTVHQQCEFVAEAIQAEPDHAVTESWGVTIDNGEITP